MLFWNYNFFFKKLNLYLKYFFFRFCTNLSFIILSQNSNHSNKNWRQRKKNIWEDICHWITNPFPNFPPPPPPTRKNQSNSPLKVAYPMLEWKLFQPPTSLWCFMNKVPLHSLGGYTINSPLAEEYENLGKREIPEGMTKC